MSICAECVDCSHGDKLTDGLWFDECKKHKYTQDIHEDTLTTKSVQE